METIQTNERVVDDGRTEAAEENVTTSSNQEQHDHLFRNIHMPNIAASLDNDNDIISSQFTSPNVVDNNNSTSNNNNTIYNTTTEIITVDALGRRGLYSGEYVMLFVVVEDTASTTPPCKEGSTDQTTDLPSQTRVPHGQGTMRYNQDLDDNNNDEKQVGGSSTNKNQLSSNPQNYDTTEVAEYTGMWQYGHWQGVKGRLLFVAGHVYTGPMEQSLRHGPYGIFQWMIPQQQEQHDSQKSPVPTTTDETTTITTTTNTTAMKNMVVGRTYSGPFYYNDRHGSNGTYIWHNTNAIYTGSFHHNQRHGTGHFIDPTNHLEYKGEWINGLYHGRGQYTWPVVATTITTTTTTTTNTRVSSDTKKQLRVYHGTFVQGKPHGQGIEYRPDGTIRHEGQWKEGKPVVDKSSKITKKKNPSSTINTTTSVMPAVSSTTSYQSSFTSTQVKEEHEWWDGAAGQMALYRGLWDLRNHCPTGTGTASYDTTGSSGGGTIQYYEGCFELGQYHGQGRLQWTNGDCYQGDFHQGNRHGQGVYLWADGKQYSGSFVNNHRHGYGTFLFKNSDTYEGEFIQGKRHGHGRFVFTDGSLYEGGWQDGRYDGPGTLVRSDGKSYDGNFAEGQYSGHGKEMDLNGNIIYEGEWIQGQRADHYEKSMAAAALSSSSAQLEHDIINDKKTPVKFSGSRADFRSPDVADGKKTGINIQSPTSVLMMTNTPEKETIPQEEDCQAVVDQPIEDAQNNAGRYTGLVLTSTLQPHGVGRLVYADGKRIHEGFWAHGHKEGHGRCLFFPQGDFHEGEYKDNLRHGKGKYIWQDGRSYVGEYKYDLRDGKGTFKYPTGECYTGTFVKGHRCGHGKFEFENGTGLYEGAWEAGRYHGYGKLKWGEGLTYEGEFAGGCFHGEGVKKNAESEIVQEGVWSEGRFQDPQSDSGVTDECAPMKEKKITEVEQIDPLVQHSASEKEHQSLYVETTALQLVDANGENCEGLSKDLDQQFMKKVGKLHMHDADKTTQSSNHHYGVNVD